MSDLDTFFPFHGQEDPFYSEPDEAEKSWLANERIGERVIKIS